MQTAQTRLGLVMFSSILIYVVICLLTLDTNILNEPLMIQAKFALASAGWIWVIAMGLLAMLYIRDEHREKKREKEALQGVHK